MRKQEIPEKLKEDVLDMLNGLSVDNRQVVLSKTAYTIAMVRMALRQGKVIEAYEQLNDLNNYIGYQQQNKKR